MKHWMNNSTCGDHLNGFWKTHNVYKLN